MVKKQGTSTSDILFRMMLRTLKKNIAQFLSIIAIGAIAVTLFCGLISNADVFETQVDSVFAKGNLADLWVTTQHYDKDDEERLSSFLEDGEEIEGRFYLPVKGLSHSFYLSVVRDLPKISSIYDTDIDITKKDFVYVDRSIREEVGSKFIEGGPISFSLDISSYKSESMKNLIPMLDTFLKDGGKNIFSQDKIDLDMTITGFMDYPENINKAAYQSSVVLISDSAFKKAVLSLFTNNFQSQYVNIIYSAVASYLGFNSMDSQYITNPNQYLIKASKDRDLDSLSREIRDYYSSKEDNNLYYVTKRSQMPFYVTVYNDVKQARQFTFVFPMVFFLVAVLVILTTLSQLVLKDRNQIGTLKALGVGKKHIYGFYISLTCSLVFLSTLIGEIVGPLLIPSILGNKYNIIYTLPGRQYHFPVLYGLLTALIFLLFSAFVTFLTCHREVSLKPCESMRPKVVKMKKKGREVYANEKTGFFSLKMAMRNIFLNKAKSLMVILGVMGCTALLVCGFGIEDTVNYGIQEDIDHFRGEDITLNFNASISKKQLEEDLYAIDGVEYFESSITATCTAYLEDGPREDTTFYIVPDESRLKKVDFSIDGIAISEKISRKLDCKVGDEIFFLYNNVEYKGKVDTIYQAFFYNGIMVHEGNSIFHGQGELLYQSAALDVSSEADISAIKDKLQTLSYVSDAKTQKEWQERIESVLSGILVMTNAVKIFAILLGVVVLYNLSLMNFKERSRDIATLKVLGFNSFEILRSLLIESMTLTAVGVLFGLGLGYPFMLAVLMTNIVELVEYIYYISILSYFLSFLLTFGVAILINLVLAKRSKTIQMVESLKSVE